jgi:RsiW-degrading membrane proteinase PrsW (M82 family)
MANLFWDYKVEPYMFEGMIYLAMAGLGFTASEKFAAINNKTEKNS